MYIRTKYYYYVDFVFCLSSQRKAHTSNFYFLPFLQFLSTIVCCCCLRSISMLLLLLILSNMRYYYCYLSSIFMNIYFFCLFFVSFSLFATERQRDSFAAKNLKLSEFSVYEYVSTFCFRFRH